jgi:hypothetical protein
MRGHIVFEQLRVTGGRNASGLVDVLVGERDPVERPMAPAGFDLRLGLSRRCQRPLALKLDECVDPAFVPVDSSKACFRQSNW